MEEGQKLFTHGVAHHLAHSERWHASWPLPPELAVHLEA